MTVPSDLAALLDALDWPDFRVAGVCAETDPEIFFPEKGEGGKVRQARRLCASCDVREACREYAIQRGEPYGIWGGTTADERRRIRAERRRGRAA